ncbi:TIGR02710 family CRISPR-associated CARF protein [soil metagenome]
MAEKSDCMKSGLAHIVTVGTTPAGAGSDVIDALIKDLRAVKAKDVVLIATSDSMKNAARLVKGLGIPDKAARIFSLKSANSLDEAYQATSTAISELLASEWKADEIILHYTAGTKVMSAGAVLAALRHEVQALRYLFSRGPGHTAIPTNTAPQMVLLDNKIRLAAALMREMRFRAAMDLMAVMSHVTGTDAQRRTISAMQQIALAYAEWDSFRAQEFLRIYRHCEADLKSDPVLAQFTLPASQIANLELISRAEKSETLFPDELLIDMANNAIRRLAERRPDDALIRLHRAAELLAQGILLADFGIRTDDVDIRMVPPRSRTSFEAERRVDDATIKLGLRKSYELLEILGSPIGKAYARHEPLKSILQERRNFVLAHGTRPASMQLALEFYVEVEDLFAMRVKDFRKRADAQQFPWIKNADVIARLSRKPAANESVIEGKATAKKAKATKPKKAATKAKSR